MTNQSKKKSRKWLWIGGGLLLLLIVIFIALPRLTGSGPAASAQAEAGTGETVTAFIGDLSANATASGQIEAQRQAQLALSQSGTIAEILVEVGDAVNEGDPLLRLESADLERGVLNAQQTLAIQEANLANLLAPASAADIASAEASVASAQAALSDLLDGPSEEEIAKAEADVRAANADIAAASAQYSDASGNATAEELAAAQLQLDLAEKAATEAAQQHSTVLVTEPEGFISQEMINDMEISARSQALQANANLAAAQETYNQLLNGDPNSVASASAQIALATASRDAAQANLDLLLQGPSGAEIAAQEANVAQAEASLARLLQGPSDAQVVQMETAVEQARIQLQNAERNLAEATLTAPFAGIITAVYANEGEQATGILVEMLDNNSLEVVLAVDEIDIGKIIEGQPAIITLETWPDEEIDGEVASIAPMASNTNSAVVSYDVFVALGETDLPVLVGMTANADLLTDNLENVLLVPNSAINADRNTGTFTVNLVITDSDGNETYEEKEVTLGLRDGRFTQILDGVEEGDELLVGNLPPRFQFGPGNDNDGGPGGGPQGG